MSTSSMNQETSMFSKIWISKSRKETKWHLLVLQVVESPLSSSYYKDSTTQIKVQLPSMESTSKTMISIIYAVVSESYPKNQYYSMDLSQIILNTIKHK